MPKKTLAPIVIEETPLAIMTIEEAQAATNVVKSRVVEAAVALYALRERKGYQALGYADFQSYYMNALQMDKSTIYHWLTRVEATVSVLDKPVSDFLQGTFEGELLPQESAGQLMRLPTVDLRKVAWAEVEGIRAIGQRMENQYYSQLVKIVKRLGGQVEPDIAAMKDAAVDVPPVKQKEFKVQSDKPSKKGAKDVPVEQVDEPQEVVDSSDYDAQLAAEAEEVSPTYPSTLEAGTATVESTTDTSVTVSATHATDIISETASDVQFDCGWLIVRYEEPGRVPISLKFDVVHMQSVIFDAAQFIRANDQ